MISTAEALETALAPAAEAPKVTPKPSAAKRARNVVPKKAKSGKKGHPREESAQERKGRRHAGR